MNIIQESAKYNSYLDMSDENLALLFNEIKGDNKEEAAQSLARLYFSLIEKMGEEKMSDSFIVLHKCFESFDPAKSPNGIKGFPPYFFSQVKYNQLTEYEKEFVKSNNITWTEYREKKAKSKTEEERYKETGDKSVLETKPIFGLSLDYDFGSSGEDPCNLHESVGTTDNNEVEANEVLSFLSETERDILHRVSIDKISLENLSLMIFGYASQQRINAISNYISNILLKISAYYEDDYAHSDYVSNMVDELKKKGLKSANGKSSIKISSESDADLGVNVSFCKVCGTAFYPRHKDHTYCCLKCARKSNRIKSFMSREWFVEQLIEKTFGEIAMDLDVHRDRAVEYAWYFGINSRIEAFREKGIKLPAGKFTNRPPEKLEGYPSRDEMIQKIKTMPVKHIQRELNISEKYLIKLISWYSLEKEYNNRPPRILTKAHRERITQRNKEIKGNNSYVRKKRIARGWDPEIPPYPTREQMLEVMNRMNWRQMEDHFQISHARLRVLAKEYKIYNKKKLYIVPNAKEHYKNRAEAQKESTRRGRHVPSKEEIIEALSKHTFVELVDIWGWSTGWIKNKIEEYEISKETLEECAFKRRCLKNPLPPKEDFVKLMHEMSLRSLCQKTGRKETTLRQDVKRVGLSNVFLKHYPISKTNIENSLKTKSIPDVAEEYGCSKSYINRRIKECNIDTKLYDKERKLQEKIKKQLRDQKFADYENRKQQIIKFFISKYRTVDEIKSFLGVKSVSSYKTILKHLELDYLLEQNNKRLHTNNYSNKLEAEVKKISKEDRLNAIANQIDVDGFKQDMEDLPKRRVQEKYRLHSKAELVYVCNKVGVTYAKKRVKKFKNMPPVEVVEKMLSEGMSFVDIAKIIKCDPNALISFAKEKGIKNKRVYKKDLVGTKEELSKFIEDGLTINAISKKTGFDCSTVKQALISHNIEFKVGWNPGTLPSKEVTKQLFEEGMSLSAIARKHKVSVPRMRAAVKKYGLGHKINKKRAPSKEELINMRSTGMSWAKIAAECNLTNSGLMHYRNKYGLKGTSA